jgi:hypothetical protein
VPEIKEFKPMQTPSGLNVKISPIQPKQLDLEILPPERIIKRSPSISTDNNRRTTPVKRKAVSVSRLSCDHRQNKENVFFKFNDLQLTAKVIPLMR